MNIILWIIQVLLAVTFIWAAYMKLFAPTEDLNKMWPWTTGNETLVKLTGVLDLLAGAGLVLPAFLRIQPKLTVYTAYATVVLMIAAGVFHISRGEASQIGFNIFSHQFFGQAHPKKIYHCINTFTNGYLSCIGGGFNT